MEKQFSSVHLLTAIFVVLLVVVMGETALAKTKLSGIDTLATLLDENSQETAYSWAEKDATQTQIFVKRAKKNIRFGKSFLHYTSAPYRKGILAGLAGAGSYQHILSRNFNLLILYCVLQI
ncbi:MAG: hypothetical protein AAF944_07875 [Bacteroidota bacterium]